MIFVSKSVQLSDHTTEEEHERTTVLASMRANCCRPSSPNPVGIGDTVGIN